MELNDMSGINVSPKNVVEIRQNSLIIAALASAGYPGATSLVESAAEIEAYITKDVNIDTLDEGTNLQDLLASAIGLASVFIDQEKKEEPVSGQEPVAYEAMTGIQAAEPETAAGIQATETEIAEKPKKTK